MWGELTHPLFNSGAKLEAVCYRRIIGTLSNHYAAPPNHLFTRQHAFLARFLLCRANPFTVRQDFSPPAETRWGAHLFVSIVARRVILRGCFLGRVSPSVSIPSLPHPVRPLADGVL